MNPTLELLGVLPTMMDARTTLGGQVHEEIKKKFPWKSVSDDNPSKCSFSRGSKSRVADWGL
jgi:chromosome partitioning protein